MNKKEKRFLGISIRYLFLILVAFNSFWIFYFILRPLTLYPVYFLLKTFYNVSLSGIILQVEKVSIEIINACIAGSAYYLLLILNLSIPSKIFKRLKMICFAFLLLLIMNILRIFFFSLLAISGSSFFDLTHKIFWYFLSIFFVLGIWFLEVKIFKIKEIPLYSDLKFIYGNSSLKK